MICADLLINRTYFRCLGRVLRLQTRRRVDDPETITHQARPDAISGITIRRGLSF